MKLIYKFDLWFSINLILYYILFLCFIFKVKKIIKINIKLYEKKNNIKIYFYIILYILTKSCLFLVNFNYK